MKNTFLAKTYTLTLTVPKAILLGVVSLILISWFFFLGLVVGRGYEPENIIPQVAQMMPQAGQIASSERGMAPSATGQTPSQAQQQNDNVDANGRNIIAEADKAYRANIRQEGAAATPSTPVPPSLPPPSSASQRAAGQGTAGQGTAGQAQNQTVTQGDATTFKFVYQLASFKEEKAAQDLKNKLAAAGYTARVTTSKGAQSTWYRIIVDFTGTQAQADAARGTIKKNFKLGEPLKLSQKKSGT